MDEVRSGEESLKASKEQQQLLCAELTDTLAALISSKNETSQVVSQLQAAREQNAALEYKVRSGEESLKGIERAAPRGDHRHASGASFFEERDQREW